MTEVPASLLILHLSDMHLDGKGPNPVLDRAEAVAAAVASSVGDPRQLAAAVVLFSGDVAFHGAEAEYTAAEGFLARVESALVARLGLAQIHRVVVPGNHDCDFALANRNRENNLRAVVAGEAVDQSVIDACTGVQAPFFAFAERWTGRPCAGLAKLHTVHRVEVGPFAVAVHGFNTAWLSHLHEKPNESAMPVELFASESSEVVDYSLVTFHHPYAWLERFNSKRFQDYVANLADRVLTGHEHEEASFTLARAGEEVFYEESGALQENGRPRDARFGARVLDFRRGTEFALRFSWNGERFAGAAAQPAPLHRNPRRRSQPLALRDEVQQELDRLDSPIVHPARDRLRLSELYVSPSLERSPTGPDTSQEATELIDGERALDFLVEARRAFVEGTALLGKTALAKALFRGLFGRGLHPVFLSAERFSTVDPEAIRNRLVEQYAATYQVADPPGLMQKPKGERSAVIDDLDRYDLRPPQIKRLLEVLAEHFERIYVFRNASLQWDIVHATPEGSTPPFEQLSMLPLGAAERLALIRRWVLLDPAVAGDDSAMIARVDAAEKEVDAVLTNPLVPTSPLYVLIVLQHAAQSLQNVASGVHLYDLMIQFKVAREANSGSRSRAISRFSALVARRMYDERTAVLDEGEMRAIYNAYNEAFTVPLPFDRLLALCLQSDIFARVGESYEFRSGYLYSYFLATHIASAIGNPEVQDLVRRMVAELADPAHGQVIVFLAHLSRDDFLVHQIVDSARTQFAEFEPCDLDASVTAFTNLVADRIGEFTERYAADPMSERVQQAKERDRTDRRPRLKIDRDKLHDGGDLKADAQALRLAERLAVSERTVQAIGILLQTFGPDIHNDLKLQLTREAYLLGLRSLAYVLKGLEPLLEFVVVQNLREWQARLEPGEQPLLQAVENALNALVFHVAQELALRSVRSVARAVAAPDLKRLFERVVDPSEAPGVRMVDFAVQLELSGSELDVRRIQRVWRSYKGKLFATRLLVRLVGVHLRLWPCPPPIRLALERELSVRFLPTTRDRALSALGRRRASLPSSR